MKFVLPCLFALLPLAASAAQTAPAPPPPPPPPQQISIPQPILSVTLSYAEWAQVAVSVRRSEAITASAADYLVSKIANQIAAEQKAAQAAALKKGMKK
jgi:hypothetical protein